MDTQELRSKRAALIEQARVLNDLAHKEDRDFTAEETENYEKLMADAEKLHERIERDEELSRIEDRSRQPQTAALQPPAEPDGKPVERRATQEYRGAFDSWMRNQQAIVGAGECRALQADIDTAGGYLLPPQQFVNTLIQAVDDLVFMRQPGWATIQQVPNAESLGAPSLDNDPADPTWTAEIAIGAEDSTMDFGKRELIPHPLAQFIKVSNTLLRKAPNAEGIVTSRLAYKISTVAENAYLNGTGANQPLGVFTASANGISTGRDVSTDNTTTSMTFDGLTNVKYNQKVQYYPRLKWMFHRDGVKQIAKLKDGEGQYIWRQSVVTGEPDTILGFPVFMSEFAPNTFTTGLYVGILGDFSFYWIADALNVAIQKLVELYAATNQVGFISRLESDGMPVLEEAFTRVKLG